MASSAPFTLRWGIMATGGIAEKFAKDILLSPSTRSVSDVAHVLAAVSSSTSAARAAEFVKTVAPPASHPPVATYGSYAELVADGAVDIVYVATPHSHHFQNAMLALRAGKHVLCEKSLTVTAAQARALVAAARERGLFLMEAVWTRFFPLSVQVRDLIRSGAIGDVYRVFADLSLDLNKPNRGFNVADSHRLLDLRLAGGATLDVGIYSLTWVFQTLYHTLPAAAREDPVVTSNMVLAPTGADENTSIVVRFPKSGTLGVASSSFRWNSYPKAAYDDDSDDGLPGGPLGPSIRIQGSLAEIQVFGPAYRPLKYRVVPTTGAPQRDPPRLVDCPIPTDPARGNWGNGMFWEADECARCVRDGRLESVTMPLAESVLIMRVMEQALQENGVRYPDAITSDVYDAESAHNTGKR